MHLYMFKLSIVIMRSFSNLPNKISILCQTIRDIKQNNILCLPM